MDNRFFERPILNSPYEYPARYWELDESGQPTQQIIETRRPAKYITPIPRPKKHKTASAQADLVFDEGKGLSTQDQQYDPTPVINQLHGHVDRWQSLPNPNDWQVTPETARLLQHSRHHPFNSIKPFFCQVEAVETAIWLTEIAPTVRAGKRFLEHLADANNSANPLHLIVEINGYRREDAKDKKSAVETSWPPGTTARAVTAGGPLPNSPTSTGLRLTSRRKWKRSSIG
jgi:type III restriction enzyme